MSDDAQSREICTNRKYRRPSRMQKEQHLVDRPQWGHSLRVPGRCRLEEAEAVRQEAEVEVRYQEEGERSPKHKSVGDSNSSPYRPRQSEGNLSAMTGWHGTDGDMSEAYIHRKHCKQRTGLVLGGAPSVAAPESPSLSRVLPVLRQASPPSELSRVAPAAHQGRCHLW